MAIGDRHVAAERAFRELMSNAGLPSPDEVSYEEASVVFLWHEAKLVVVVDLDDARVEEVAIDDGAAAA